MIESLELGTSQRREPVPMRIEAELTFMLARPALTRWQFEAERLRQLANNWSPAKRGLALMESELGLAQIKALADRIAPLTESQDMAVRFEAQETLVALDSVGGRLGNILDEVREEKSRGGVDEIKAAALAPMQLRRAAAAGRHGHAAAAASGEGRDDVKRQAARFDTRYIDHLVGRSPKRVGTQNETAAPPTDEDTAFEQAVRKTAYLLWEQNGRPENRAEEYWQSALERHRSERVRNGSDRAAGATGNQAPRPQQSRSQEAYDAFAELAATLGSLCEEPEAPAGVAGATDPPETPPHDAES